MTSAPCRHPEGFSPFVPATATDADGDVLLYSATGLPPGISYNSSTGLLSGTLSSTAAVGSPYSVTLNVTDSNGGFDVDTVTWTVTDTNQPPSITPISDITIDELTNLSFNAIAADPDLPTNTLTYTATGLPTGATLNSVTGAFDWTPTENQGPGSYPIVVTATDDGSPIMNASTSFTITVDEVASDPVLAPIGSQTSGEGSSVTLTPVATDADIPADTLLWTATNLPPGLSIDSASGAITGTINATAGAGSPYAVTVTVDDQNGGTDSEIFGWTITDTNQNPTLNTIAPIAVTEGTPITFTASGADPDLPADTLTYTATGLPAGATFDGPSATFNWTPTEAQGPGTFVVTITVTDDGTPNLSASQPATLTITESNTSPVITPIGDATSDELANINFTAVATDVDLPANTLTYTATGLPVGATLNSGTGEFDWTPTEAQGPGTYPITITATDNGTPNLSDSSSFTLTIDEIAFAPVLNPVGDQTSGEGIVVSLAPVATDADIPTDTLLWTATNLPPGLIIDSATGSITGTVSTTAGVSSPYAVTITVDDQNGGTDSELLTWTITNTNQRPTIAAVSDSTSDELVNINFTAVATDLDLPADTLTYSATGLPTGATLHSGTGEFDWTPTEAQGPGTYPITITATDNGVPALSDSTSFTLTIDEVAIAPVLNPVGNQLSGEGSTVMVTPVATDPDIPTDTLLWTATNLPPGLTIDSATGVIDGTIDATAGASSPYAVTISVDDQTGGTDSELLTWTITNTNRNPALGVIAPMTVSEGTPIAFTASGSDPDLPADALTFSATGLPAGATINSATGAFAWTPTEAQGPGTFVVTITVTDDGTPNLTASQPITITVTESNTAPVLAAIADATIDETQSLTIPTTATDVDLPANTITYTVTGAPPGATFNTTTGDLLINPREINGPGTFPITITATDDGAPALSDTTTFTLTIDEVNSAPVLGAVADLTVNELAPMTISLVATDADRPNDTFTFSATGLPVGANLDPATGAISWTPTEADGPGSFTFDVSVADDGVGALSDSQTITIVVNEVNAAPIFAPMADLTTVEGDNINVVITATDTDIPTNTLTYTAAGLPPGLAINPASGRITGTLSFTDSASSPFTVTVAAADGNGGLGTSTFSLIVENTNRAPVIQSVPTTISNELEPLSIVVSADDPDGDDVVFSLDGAPSGLTIDPNSGLINWNPDENDGPATYRFDVVATDDDRHELTTAETITIVVNEVNSAPTLAVPSTKSAPATSEFRLGITAFDPDLPADELEFTVESGPEGLTIEPTTGVLRWTPDIDLVGTTHDVTVRVVDDGTPSLSDQMTFAVDVLPATLAFVDLTAAGDSFTVPFGEPTELDVLDNDQGANISVSAITQPVGGTTTVRPNGIVRFEPDPGFTGLTSFEYTIGSEDGGAATASVTVVVGRPELRANDDEAKTQMDRVIRIDVLLNDVLASSIVELTVGGAANGKVETSDDGQVLYLPDTYFTGTDQFQYTITDEFGTTRSATVRINVVRPALTPAAQELVEFDVAEPTIQTIPPSTISFEGLGLSILKAIRALQLPTQLLLIAGMWSLLFILAFTKLEKRPTIRVVSNVDRFETVTVYSTNLSQEIFELRHDTDLLHAAGRRVRRQGVWYRKIQSPAGPGLIEDRYLEDMNRSYLDPTSPT